MAAGQYSFVLEQGATFSRVFTLKDNTGALVNLTGFSAVMRIEDEAGNLKAQPTLSLGGAAGTITVSLTAAQTAALNATPPRVPLVYDLKITAADGVTSTRVLEGNVVVSRAVS